MAPEHALSDSVDDLAQSFREMVTISGQQSIHGSNMYQMTTCHVYEWKQRNIVQKCAKLLSNHAQTPRTYMRFHTI